MVVAEDPTKKKKKKKKTTTTTTTKELFGLIHGFTNLSFTSTFPENLYMRLMRSLLFYY